MSKWDEMASALELARQNGLEVNINDNTLHYRTVWIGWACPQLDCEDFIHKADVEGDIADAVLDTYEIAIKKKNKKRDDLLKEGQPILSATSTTGTQHLSAGSVTMKGGISRD